MFSNFVLMKCYRWHLQLFRTTILEKCLKIANPHCQSSCPFPGFLIKFLNQQSRPFRVRQEHVLKVSPGTNNALLERQSLSAVCCRPGEDVTATGKKLCKTSLLGLRCRKSGAHACSRIRVVFFFLAGRTRACIVPARPPLSCTTITRCEGSPCEPWRECRIR